MKLEDLKGDKKVLDTMIDFLYMDFSTGERKETVNDVGYTQEHIDECSEILNRYIDDLLKARGKSSNEQISNIVKNVAEELNKLNEKCDYSLIETDQREELVPFILKAAELAGLESDGDDITEEWREW